MINIDRSILDAALIDDTRFLDHPDERMAFINRQRWLLAKNILPRLRRKNRQRHMPMVRRRYHHRVDIVPRKHIPEVVIRFAVLIPVGFVNNFFRFIPSIFEDITNRNDLRFGNPQKIRQIIGTSMIPHADTAQRDSAARCRDGTARSRRRENTDDRCGRSEKSTSRKTT